MRAYLSRAAIAAALALSAAVPSLAQQRQVAEREVRLPAEADLVVGHQAREGRSILVELVPAGETVENFSRMVTLQTAPGMGSVPEAEYLQAFADRYAGGCPRSAVLQVPFGTVAEGVRIDCPKHPNTGQMETVFARVLDVDDDLAMVQITMKYFVMPKDGQWARDYLSRVEIR